MARHRQLSARERLALRAMANLAEAGLVNFKISVVMTRHNVPELDEFAALADRFGAQLRITRLRPAGRGAASLGRSGASAPADAGP